MLSRLPIPELTQTRQIGEVTVLNLQQIQTLPLTATQLKFATRHDPVLSKVLRNTKRGWPVHPVAEDLKPYWSHRDELTVEADCLLRGVRVIVPTKYWNRVLSELHGSHSGVVRMKAIARSHVWWPGIDQDIETTVKSCIACQSLQHLPPGAPLHSWTWPDRLWDSVHVDFVGPFLNRHFLVAVDAYSPSGQR